MIDTKEWPCAFYSWITGWQKWLSNTNRSKEDTTDKLRKPVGMISRWQKYISVPCHPHRFTQDTVSDFLCFSTSVCSSSSDWLQMATLFTEGWGVSCWRKMESSKSTSHSRSLVPSSVEAPGSRFLVFHLVVLTVHQLGGSWVPDALDGVHILLIVTVILSVC